MEMIGIDAGGLFEGDLFGDVTASSSGAGASAMPGTSAQPQSLQVCLLNLLYTFISKIFLF